MEKQTKKSPKYSFCFPSFVFNNYQTSTEKTLILDMRDTQEFHKHHIFGSINLSNLKLQDCIQKKLANDVSGLAVQDIQESLDQKESKKFSKRRRCFCFFIVSESNFSRVFLQELKRQLDFDEHDDFLQITEANLQKLLSNAFEGCEEQISLLNTINLFRMLQKDKVREIYIVLEGATSFFTRYPYMAHHGQSDAVPNVIPKNVFSSFACGLPHDILEGRLFLGSYKQSEQYCLLQELKITHVVNVTIECDNVHEDKGIKYLKLSILDECDKAIHMHFKEAYEFIYQALTEDENNSVLIHCAMGKSRSATITIMFLMKRFMWNFEKAFTFVKRKRETVCPNEGFIERLQEFEKHALTFEEWIQGKEN